MNTTPSVSEEMIEAGVKAIRSLPARPGGYVEYDAIARAAYLAMKASEPYAGQTDVERVWAALKEQCCSSPSQAKRCVMVSRDDLAAALLVSNRSGVEAKLRERVADLELALDLALHGLGEMEPGDSRAVSNEFVAMAAIRCEQDNLDECRDIIRSALDTPTTLEEEG